MEATSWCIDRGNGLVASSQWRDVSGEPVRRLDEARDRRCVEEQGQMLDTEIGELADLGGNLLG